MVTKLKVTIFITTLLTITGCGVSKELREERRNWNFTNWEQGFKDRTLCLCMLKGFSNKSLEDSIIKYDKSFYNPLAIAIFDSTIEEFLKKELKRMRADSIKSVGRYPDDISSLLEGKRIFQHCIELYRSERLDSVVRDEKKRWRRISSIINKIHEKVPTY